ncbi:WXG100 family type VII secretion target [Butyrivibrio sp. YAB3001]|uniref:WXG100 family type VII secretion target n=1 Tax=Butyrivibrio sp. YAB3001 TaxID=1520812 RepID=UPI0008F68499|nr:hypothetical protein [Butyrivibrio sp. YAB3001]SFB82452.1 hypothetical protein SAMN02910398_00759 [Butyrivibrio sp. YAB3001]
MAERMANNLESFNGDIDEYRVHLQQLTDHFNEMITHMSELNSMWEGEAHNDFLSTFEVDKSKTFAMLDDFKKVLSELEFAHTEYSQCENNISNMIEEMSV